MLSWLKYKILATSQWREPLKRLNLFKKYDRILLLKHSPKPFSKEQWADILSAHAIENSDFKLLHEVFSVFPRSESLLGDFTCETIKSIPDSAIHALFTNTSPRFKEALPFFVKTCFDEMSAIRISMYVKRFGSQCVNMVPFSFKYNNIPNNLIPALKVSGIGFGMIQIMPTYDCPEALLAMLHYDLYDEKVANQRFCDGYFEEFKALQDFLTARASMALQTILAENHDAGLLLIEHSSEEVVRNIKKLSKKELAALSSIPIKASVFKPRLPWQ